MVFLIIKHSQIYESFTADTYLDKQLNRKDVKSEFIQIRLEQLQSESFSSSDGPISMGQPGFSCDKHRKLLQALGW